MRRHKDEQPIMATAAGRAAGRGGVRRVRGGVVVGVVVVVVQGWLVTWWREGASCTRASRSRSSEDGAHAGLRTGGAKAFRADPPARLRYAETAANRADATRREMALKRLARADKLALIQSAMLHDRDEESGGAWGRPLSPEELAASDPFARDRSSHDKKTAKPDQ